MTIKQLAVLALVMLFLTACGPPAQPTVEGPAIYIRAAEPKLKVGEPATISVDIQSIAYLAGVDIAIVYDPTTLELVADDGAEAAAVTEVVNPEFTVMNTVQDGELRVVYASSTPSDQPDGTLFTFEVVPLEKGTTTIRFVTVKLAGQGGTAIEATPVDLSVRVK